MKSLADRLIREVLRAGALDRSLYAIVDCARDPAVFDALGEPALEVRCLYSGALPDELARAAPYLVRLGAASAFTDVFREAWGRSWGILVRASADIDELRRHFMKLNVVRGPDGRRLLFRYYDPRVLRVFLPTCDREQLAETFGPVQELVVEGEDCLAVHFTFDGRSLSCVRHDGSTSGPLESAR